jgi:hypothetical protein
MLTRPRLLTIAPLLAALLSAMCLVLLAGSPAQAALPDPTRPPASLGPIATPTAPSVASSASAAGTRTAAPASAPPAPRIQAVRLPTAPSAGRASAVIDGKLLQLGDRLGDATVQEIRSDGVWMRLSRGGTQWLGLYAPAAEARQP